MCPEVLSSALEHGTGLALMLSDIIVSLNLGYVKMLVCVSVCVCEHLDLSSQRGSQLLCSGVRSSETQTRSQGGERERDVRFLGHL